MPIRIITSYHNLRRDVLSTTELHNDAAHRVWCDTHSVGPMTLDEAQHHVDTTPMAGNGPMLRLFTIA